MGVRLRRYGAADWRRFRDLRLEMLADCPIAYVETLAEAQQLTDEQWQRRAGWADEPHHVGLAADDPDSDRWVGLARGSSFDEFDRRPFVFSFYVAPSHRGTGLADALLDGIAEWTRSEGHRELYLFVHQHNARAIAFYRRRNFEFTGVLAPYPQNLAEVEREMRLQLSGPRG
jgi:ribosomal protein S18 acetylase RimI-like enzyme